MVSLEIRKSENPYTLGATRAASSPLPPCGIPEPKPQAPNPEPRTLYSRYNDGGLKSITAMLSLQGHISEEVLTKDSMAKDPPPGEGAVGTEVTSSMMSNLQSTGLAKSMSR